MNLKNLLTKFALLALLVVFFAGSTQAQTTYYVDVVNGLDGYNGLTPNVLGAGQGPKQTINNAIAAASDGDIISVAYANGNLYNEAVTVGNKKLTFTSTGGTPVVVSLTVNNTVAAPDDITTFTGPFKFNTGLTLTDGRVIGASNLTVGGTVTRNVVNATVFGSVDSQLNYTGAVAFSYIGGAAVTAGFELPPASNTTNFGNLTTAAGSVLTLNENKTMNGILATGAELKLGTYTLNIVGSGAHTNGAAITNGTLNFEMDGATSITGAFAIPNVIASDDESGFTLTIASATATGDITANVDALVIVTAATTVGNVTNNSTGTVTLTAATASKTLNNTSTGIIDANAAGGLAVTGNVMNSGLGSIELDGLGGAVTVSGTVTNSPSIVVSSTYVSGANDGTIIFPDQTVTITGKVTNSTSLSGTNGTANVAHVNIGEIRFLNTASTATLTGGLTISSTGSFTKGTGTLSITNSGGVVFSTVAGNILIPGGITVSSTFPAVTGATITGNGSLDAVLRNGGTFGTLASRTGAIIISSSATNGANGNVNITSAANDGFFGSSVTTTGAAGGYFNLGDEDVNMSGSVVNQRTVTGNHLNFGTAPTNGITVQIAGNVSNEGKSNINFLSFQGDAATTFAVTGKLMSSGTGTITVDPAATLAGTGTFSLGGVDITSGTIDLQGAAGSIMDVVVNGPSNFAGGTFDVGTTVAPTTNLTVTPVAIVAGDRVLQLGGLSSTFSTASGNTSFGAAATSVNTLLLIQPTSVVAAQTITGNASQTVWPGPMVVKNPTGLQPAVTFTGGNFRVLSDVAFDLSQVKLDGTILFVGGLLAPNNGVGNFYNHPGYTTVNNAFVSMNGNAGATVGGAGTFESFEVDMAAGATVAGTFKSTFNLTNGTVTGGAAIVFNNTDPYPTIVRNAGTFAGAPTFTSMVNVYYIGLDKATANELPAAANKLNNLTVATTNGAVAGKGTVNVGVATTVNGTLNVFPNQALLINGVDLTMAGETIVLDGIIANVAAADELVFGRAAGTTVTGSGWLPDVRVAVNSEGNMINGAKGLVTQFLGANNVWGTDDFSPTVSAASGSIVFGAGTGDLSVAFGSGALNGTHFMDVTTAHANNTLTLAGNAVGTGGLVHAAGNIDVATFKLTLRGAAQAITSGATIMGDGTLEFIAAPTTLTTATDEVVIDVNTTVNTTAGNFTLAGQDLVINGDLTVTASPGANGFSIGGGLTLTAAGENVTMASGTAFLGAGILLLDKAAAEGVLTFNATGAVAIANLTIADDVLLNVTGVGAAVTVGTAFLHSGGNLDFGDLDLTITGTYNRTAGTYTAGDGYLVINNGTFNQGASAFTIPNLRFTANGTQGAAGQTGVVTVTGNLDLANGGTIDISNANTGNTTILNLGDGATIIYSVGASRFDVNPTFAGAVNITTGVGAGGPVIHSTVWPTGLTVNKLTINNLAAGNTVELPGDRTVQNEIDLRVGTLDLGTTANITLTLANSTVRRRDGGSVVLNGGTLAYTNPVDLYYESTGGAIVAGPEVISPLNMLTIARTGNVANAAVTFNTAFTVNTDINISNDITANANITLLGDLSVSTAANALATAPVVNFVGSALTFGGTEAQMINVPAGVTAFGAIEIDNAAGVWLSGGNLNLGGILTLTDGLFYTGDDNYVQLLNTPGTAVQGYTKVAGSTSHVVGNVRKNIKFATNPGFGRNEFPVGSETTYRPVAITIVDVNVAPAAMGIFVTANNQDGQPTGIVGLPIVNGIEQGIDIARYPDFYWNIASSASLGNTVFDLELTTENFTDFSSFTNVRMIRRIGNVGDVTNPWSLQGAADAYDNFVSGSVLSIVNVGSVGGIRPQGAIFTYGLKTRLSASTLPNLTLNQGDAYKVAIPLGDVFSGSQGELVYTASSTNEAVATVEVDGDTLWVTGVGNGQSEISVRATDTNQDFLTVTFTVSTNPVGVEELGIPTTFALEQNYPNPFNPTTVIRFGLPEQSNVVLRVYNILGQEVATLLNTVKAAGWHEVNFNASQLGSGLYIYRIEAKDFVSIKKMMLVK